MAQGDNGTAMIGAQGGNRLIRPAIIKADRRKPLFGKEACPRIDHCYIDVDLRGDRRQRDGNIDRPDDQQPAAGVVGIFEEGLAAFSADPA